jgi:hypothetical protein
VVPTAIDEMYSEYASGNSTVVFERLGAPGAFDRLRPEIVTTLPRWRTEWTPQRAAFALEVAITAYARKWPDPRSFLDAARAIVVARPDPPGTRPDGDAFESQFHRTAVALLAAMNAPQDVERYLDAIRDRMSSDGTPAGAAKLSDPRLLLARAIAREVQALPASLASRRGRDGLRSWTVAADDGDARKRLDVPLRLLRSARGYAETRAEASVRYAFLLHRLGQHPDALAALDAIPSNADRTVEYWRALVRGRILTTVGRMRDAVTEYERAAALVPGVQTPAVALAALQLKLGDRDAALRWAAAARSTSGEPVDPWTWFWTGEGRFLTTRLVELRNARP